GERGRAHADVVHGRAPDVVEEVQGRGQHGSAPWWRNRASSMLGRSWHTAQLTSVLSLYAGSVYPNVQSPADVFSTRGYGRVVTASPHCWCWMGRWARCSVEGRG